MNHHPRSNDQIGRNLAWARALKHLSQTDVARALQLHRPAISAIEHGHQALTFAQALALRHHFGITIDRLNDDVPIPY